ncbi:helix-turn-helix transcriptional regulator [Aliidiomarina halalkaliphila]|uniref:Helix-turn-helix transcriptional regulator n=2 Tax=Aliidiomarina halalkaliphila TaxID=2593535 RepID=A0A552X0S7_9GAMM|nr:helix-turn-helix transcriptional regulator [Aliidiomarina halalkaliphila]
MSINAEQVRALRESRGWSQEHLAEVAGLSLRTIQRVEADGRGSRETKLSLAAAFDVPLGRLSVVGVGDAGQDSAVGKSSFSLMTIGTFFVLLGLIAGVFVPLLVAGSAVLVSGLSVYAIDYLNGMRRAAGMPPLLPDAASISGLSLFISGVMVVLLGLSINGELWWMPGGVLAGIGLAALLWPPLRRRIIGGEPTPPSAE